MTWQLSVTGLLIGALVGLTGMGGGSLMTPILILVFGNQFLDWRWLALIAAVTLRRADGSPSGFPSSPAMLSPRRQQAIG